MKKFVYIVVRYNLTEVNSPYDLREMREPGEERHIFSTKKKARAYVDSVFAEISWATYKRDKDNKDKWFVEDGYYSWSIEIEKVRIQ